MTSLLNSSALQLAVEAMQTFSGDVGVVRGACGVVDVLAEAGECMHDVELYSVLCVKSVANDTH